MSRLQIAPAILMDPGVDVLIDGFVGDVLMQIDSDPAGNLLRRPALLEMRDDIVADILILETILAATMGAVYQGPFLS